MQKNKSTQQRNQVVLDAQRKWWYKRLNGIKGFCLWWLRKATKAGRKGRGRGDESCLGTENDFCGWDL